MIAYRRYIFPALFLAFSGAASAQAPQRSPFYVGGAVGALHLDTDYASQVSNSPLPGDVGPLYDVRAEMKEKVGGRAFVGYRLTPRFSFEADYVNLGKISQGYSIPGQPLTIFFGNQTLTLGQDAFVRDGESRIDGYGVSAVAAWPLNERLSLTGRAGVVRTRLRYEERGTFLDAALNGNTNPPSAQYFAVDSPRGSYEDVQQTRPVLGLGLEYQLGDRLGLRFEWARYFGIGKDFERDGATLSNAKGKFDVDLLSVGLAFSF